LYVFKAKKITPPAGVFPKKDLCKEEILIATRVFPEIVIKTIQQESKEGTKVRVLADKGLVKEYFRLHKTDNPDLGRQNKKAKGRLKLFRTLGIQEKNIET
jgi:hypothetical protein